MKFLKWLMDLMRSIERSSMANIVLSSVSMFCFAGCICLSIQHNWRGALIALGLAASPWLFMLAVSATANTLNQMLQLNPQRSPRRKK